MNIAQSDLALSGLTKDYGSTLAVDKVTLRIEEGDLVALLGPSGCGKTTILRMIAGLTEPTGGDVLVGGHRITATPPHKRNIGMLFQNYALFPHMTIEENVAFGLRMRRIDKQDQVKRSRAALDMVQLSHLAGKHPRALSGGQQQRVALARALVIEPSLLLLDEPLGALDKNLREMMQIEIRQIQQRLGITAVLVTHDQEEALTMADQIVVMDGGKVMQMGTPSDVYTRPANRFVAGFIGASNFLRGTIAASDDGGCQLKLQDGGRAVVEGPVIASGNDVLLTVRPEAVDVSPRGEGEPPYANWVEAVMEQIIYRGQVTHLHMRLKDGSPLLAFMPNRAGEQSSLRFSIGETVVAHWLSEANHTLAES